ncbi:hypothetical protein QQP08_004489 [Theobroma cacao]|nr:hypothetical protein QQP08_004489 [Theobroma cacao]
MDLDFLAFDSCCSARNICFPVWPIFGNMRSFLKAFRSENPDTFIHDLVKRYGRPGIYKTYLFGSPSVTISIPETCRKALER